MKRKTRNVAISVIWAGNWNEKDTGSDLSGMLENLEILTLTNCMMPIYQPILFPVRFPKAINACMFHTLKSSMPSIHGINDLPKW